MEFMMVSLLTDLTSAEIETKVKQNAHDVWQLTYLTLQCLHSRKGLLESEAALVQGYLLSCTESEMMELSKEALYTASVLLSCPEMLVANCRRGPVLDQVPPIASL